jgi:hypothetical protein
MKRKSPSYYLLLIVFLFPSLGQSVPHPTLIQQLIFNKAHVKIEPSKQNICQVHLKQLNNVNEYSPFIPCPDLYAYISQKIKEIPNHHQKLEVTIMAPELFPLNIMIKEGKIQSLRNNSMQDTFKVVKGTISFKDHPDDFVQSQSKLNQRFDLQKSLDELEKTLLNK